MWRKTPPNPVTVDMYASSYKESVNVLTVKGSLGYIFCNSESKNNSNSCICWLISRHFPRSSE